MPATCLGSIAELARSLLVYIVAVRCQRRGRLVGISARGLSVQVGSSTIPATGRLVGVSAQGLSVQAAVRYKQRVQGSRERGST